MLQTKSDSKVADQVPWADEVTAYDEAHFVTYLCLLNAKGDGASEHEMARDILGIDPDEEPIRAQEAVRSHLRRAKWMTETGYRHLIDS